MGIIPGNLFNSNESKTVVNFTLMNIILFDGVCNLCNWSVNFIIKHDKNNKFKFLAQQSEEGTKRLLANGFNAQGNTTIVLLAGDKVFTKSNAVIEIGKQLSGWPRLAILLKIFPGFIRDFFYSIISKYRYTIFGRKDTCMIPISAYKDKFIVDEL